MVKYNFRKISTSIYKYINFRNAKSLVKHLLTSDLSKRYGNLKDGMILLKYHIKKVLKILKGTGGLKWWTGIN